MCHYEGEDAMPPPLMYARRLERSHAEYPAATRPECHHEQTDYDGFGLLYCEHCGYCTHPSQSGDPMTCDLCHQEIGT